MGVNHVCVIDEEIERYLLGHLCDVAAARIEECILICASCQTTFSTVDDEIRLLRAVLEVMEQGVDERSLPSLGTWPA